MQFTIVSLLAAASSVMAQLPPTAGFDAITVPTVGQTLTPGSAFEINWEPNGQTGTITIHLLQGPAPNLLMDGGLVGSGIDNTLGKFVWSPVPQGQYDAYGFNITLDQDPTKYQLSNEFHIAKGSSSHPTTLSSVVGYPTTGVSTQTSVVTLVPGPSYSQHLTSTSTSCTTSSVAAPTYPASNATWSMPPTTGYPTTSTSPSGPISTPTSPPTQGAATRFGASGLAAFGAVLLAAFVL